MRAKFVVPGLAALGIAFATQASAQSVVTRSITTEPVETIVTQTPTGTIVTRRPLAGAPAAGATIAEPDTVDAVVTREVVQRAAQPPMRELVTRDVAARPQRTVKSKTTRVKQTRTTTRTSAVQPAPQVALSPADRHIVYQTIVEREVRPQVVAPQPVVVAPPLVQTIPAVRPPVVAQEEVVVQQPAPVYTVGSVLPANTPLYAMPQNVALRVPATQSYSYAYLGGRAYLVEPASGTIVADVTE